MSFVKLNQIENFDAKNEKKFYYSFDKPGVIEKARLTITRQSDNVEIYDKAEINPTNRYCVLPGDTCKNGEYYSAKVTLTVKTSGGLSGSLVTGSNRIQFRCAVLPIVTFGNASESITSSRYTWNFSYQQEENVPIVRYVVEIYEQDVLKKRSEQNVYDGFPEYIGEFMVTNMKNGGSYKIRLTAFPANGEPVSIETAFTVSYELTPTYLSNFSVEKDCNTSVINITGSFNPDYQRPDYAELQRRFAYDDGTFSDWTPIYGIDSVNIAIFHIEDYTCPNGLSCEYKIVGYASGVASDSDAGIKKVSIRTNKVYIAGDSVVYKNKKGYGLKYNVNFETNNRFNQTAVFNPLGSTYPVVIKNTALNYDSGSLSFAFLGENYDNTRTVDGKSLARETKELVDFLSDGKTKILKDWNGNMYMVYITDNIQKSFLSGSSNTIPEIHLNWVEIGSVNSQQDMYDAGFSNILPDKDIITIKLGA